MKIRPVAADLFRVIDGRTDRRTDMMKLTVAVRSFMNIPKIFPILQLIEDLYILHVITCIHRMSCIFHTFLGAHAKLRKATITFVMAVHLLVGKEQLSSH